MSGVHIETIRYYEREGILPFAERTPSGRRCYDGQGVARLRFVRRCRDLGFSISDIRALLVLAGQATPCANAKSIAVNNLRLVRAKIKALETMESALTELIDQCDDNRVFCPLLNTLLEPALQDIRS